MKGLKVHFCRYKKKVFSVCKVSLSTIRLIKRQYHIFEWIVKQSYGLLLKISKLKFLEMAYIDIENCEKIKFAPNCVFHSQ